MRIEGEETKTKICSKCKRELPLDSYYFHKGGSKDGFKEQCKECRGSKFGITRKRTVLNIFWTEERNNLLKEFHSNFTNEELAEIFGTSKNAINTQARRLNLYKDIWWSNNELILINKYYPNMNTIDFKNKYLPKRSLQSIKKKACELGISKENKLLLNIRLNNLGGYASFGHDNLNYKGIKNVYEMCRNNLSKWIELVKQNCNYKCAITGETENLVVHHIRPFREIFYNTYYYFKEKYNFEIYNNVDKYQDNELILLRLFVKTIEQNHNINDGVLITEKLHKEFHNIYGTRKNTIEDFYSFLNHKGVRLLWLQPIEKISC